MIDPNTSNYFSIQHLPNHEVGRALEMKTYPFIINQDAQGKVTINWLNENTWVQQDITLEQIQNLTKSIQSEPHVDIAAYILQSLKDSASKTQTVSLKRSRTDEEKPAIKRAAITPAAKQTTFRVESPVDYEIRFTHITGAAPQIEPSMQDIRIYPNLNIFFVNGALNRYSNIFPGHDMVALQVYRPEEQNGSPYLNANWNPGHTTILTQGPLAGRTFGAFFLSTLENDIKSIVCLTDPFDGGRPKTDIYWQPTLGNASTVYLGMALDSNNQSQFMKVELIPVKQGDPDLVHIDLPAKGDQEHGQQQIVERRFKITIGDPPQEKIHEVRMFHFEKWRDMDVCDPEKLLFLVLRTINEKTQVHCSAGVGRSAVFDVVKHFIEKSKKENGTIPAEKEIDDYIIALRFNRPGAVQKWEQRMLISQTLAVYFSKFRGSIPAA